MADDLSHVPDDELEKFVRNNITPQFVEYVRRLKPLHQPFSAPSSAQFGYELGSRDGKQEIIDDLHRLLTEALNPETI